MYKSVMKVLLGLLFLALMACSEGADPAYEKGRIIGQDHSFWACGGGWYVEVAGDTVTLPVIPNTRIMDRLLTEENVLPLEVELIFENNPESECAINFDRVREVMAIRLVNETGAN